MIGYDTADGRTITTRTRPDELVDPAPAVGSVVPVVYDPENPQAPVRDLRVPRDIPTPPLLVGSAGVVLIGVLLVGIRRRRRRAEDGTS